MKGLLFGVAPRTPIEQVDPSLPEALRQLEATPMDIVDLPDPELRGPDWMVLKPRMTGICGSDTKQVISDVAMDNCMSAVVSFPHVLGHEMVADVVEAGPDAGVKVGQRVVLNPWLSCAVRGISPLCPACEVGDYSGCENFTRGSLAKGIHSGNSSDAPGGFAELVPAHRIMAIPVPDGVPDEIAVLADPFSVSLHAVLRQPPPPGGKALVYGTGALGTTTLAILQALYPSVEVGAITRFPHQAALAEKFGAKSFDYEPREQLVEQICEWSGATLQRPFFGLPWTYPGGVDVIYETIASASSLEVAVRVARPRGSIVITGVSTPDRFEWTPWYFKELTLIGANAFGYETVEGKRQHAIAHYLEWAAEGKIDISAMLTHTFRLEEWRDAFDTIIRQGDTGAQKVAFDFR